MPAGSSAKRGQEYQKLERGFKKEGRYKGHEEDAARIANEQRAQAGKTTDDETH